MSVSAPVRFLDEFLILLMPIASGADAESLLEPISQVLQQPLTLISLTAGMSCSLVLFWWNRHKAYESIQEFDHRMSDRLGEIREHENQVSQ